MKPISIWRTHKTTYGGLLLLSAATLVLEIGLTRILSVSLWYHFAFMVVSTALFGFGFAGVFLSLRRKAESVSARIIALSALGTPLGFVMGFFLFNQIPFEPFSLGTDPIQWLYLPLSYGAVTLPFFFSGMTIAGILTRHAEAVHQLYLADLVGAGLGSLLVMVSLPAFGGSGTVVFAAALASLGAMLLSWEQGFRWAMVGLGMAVILSLGVFVANQLLPVRISANKVTGDNLPVGQVLSDPRFCRFTAWNSISRIDVVEFRDRQGEPHRNILIDAGTAMTRLVHLQKPVEELPPTDDEESFFVQRVPKARVLVVGSGGGREVLLALRNGAAKVIAVEINPVINNLVSERMADFAGHLYEHPGVEVVTDEARSFLRRSGELFDLIQCPHTISNAALSSGSLSLSENHLMTLEAFEDYLDHLEPDGTLVITRPEAHLPRLFSTLRTVFAKRSLAGLERKILAWRQPSPSLSFYAGLAVRPAGFSNQEIQEFVTRLSRRGLEPLYVPDVVALKPYGDILQAPDLEKVELPFAAILEPATDDKPFFNRRVEFSQIRWADLVSIFSRGPEARMALEDRPVAEVAMLLLLFEVGVMALLFIVLPLLIFKRRALNAQNRLKTLLGFTALGLAYIVVEVGFIQRFTLYLGKPVLVFSTVLGTMLVFSGLGSAFSRRYSGPRAPLWACLCAASLSLLMALLSSWLVQLTLAWPEGSRVLLAMLLLMPVGFVMGMPFPLLMRRLQSSTPERIPWAFGVNGFASVVGSIGAVILGMTVGYTLVLTFGVCCYLIAALASFSKNPQGQN